MAVKTKDEILSAINDIEMEDETKISMLEDITDTIDSLSNIQSEDWKAKYEENDAMWKEKYRNRFFSGNNEKEEDFIIEEDDTTPPKPMSFEDLFTTV